MPSTRKNRRKRVNYNVNKKKLWKNFKKKKTPHIECQQIRESWDKSKSVKENLKEMGIAFNPNGKKLIVKPISEDINLEDDVKHKDKIMKPNVIEEMEAEAALGEKEKLFRLSSEDVLFCTYMMDKYNECYKAMARDKRNHYQLTPKQIRTKIRAFKRTTDQYKTYINSKKDNSNTEKMEL